MRDLATKYGYAPPKGSSGARATSIKKPTAHRTREDIPSLSDRTVDPEKEMS